MKELRRLFDIRNCYDTGASAEKLELLQNIDMAGCRSGRDLKRLHSALCFIRAFPDSVRHHKLAHTALLGMEDHIAALCAVERENLDDTGIAATRVHYQFSYPVACWLNRRCASTVRIAWDGECEHAGLDGMLRHLLHASEDEYFDGGHVSCRAWLRAAAENSGMSGFDWLLTQLQRMAPAAIWSQLYDDADLWLTWALNNSRWSISGNRLPVRKIVPRTDGMRRVRGVAHEEIRRPLDSIQLLAPAAGARMIDVAMASLAARHRETYHFNYANAQEVYLADTGCGTSIAVFGLRNEKRFPLESTLGYLILSNGVPIGYGGSSVLFRQINTGLNVFGEYRGSEAAFLWVQVMRVYHQLTGCTRFIANAYQFGAGNDEALKSGAFWTYYRLGYRPLEPAVRRLAASEHRKLRADRRYRSSLPTMRKLATCDMHLKLPGARDSELFHERWIETSSMLANETLNAINCDSRAEAGIHAGEQLASDAGVRGLHRWSRAERQGLERLAPIVAACGPGRWADNDRRTLRALLRAKGGREEAPYARQLARHGVFLRELRNACRRAERR